jgi:hypothetical protein
MPEVVDGRSGRRAPDSAQRRRDPRCRAGGAASTAFEKTFLEFDSAFTVILEELDDTHIDYRDNEDEVADCIRKIDPMIDF